MEVWKDIPGYEGYYEASNHGRIRANQNRPSYTAKGKRRKIESKILKPKNDKSNCLRVTLWKNGEHKDFLLARLVCATWHGDLINTDMTVNHIDGNRLNNNADNLEWLSRADNIRHGFVNGLYKQKRTALVNLDTNEKTWFRSQSEASRALGKNVGYIKTCLIRNRVAIDMDGEKYLIVTEAGE